MSVRLRHPDLDTEYVAQPEQVPHLRETGWRPVEGQEQQGEVWPAEAQRFEGQERVKIRHPETGGETIVAASAVPFHRERGWVVVDDAKPEPAPAGTEGPPSRQRGSKGRSRASNEPSDAGAAGLAAKEE